MGTFGLYAAELIAVTPREPLTEDLLALHLAELGVGFERQFKYVANRRFRADFGIPRHGLLIEVQGGVFSRRAHGSITGILADLEWAELLRTWCCLDCEYILDDVDAETGEVRE